ncbi:MAG: hypothetical protein KDD09_15930, partial [Phaeodactylibacter sp.]|nr:hypothetical protein [Phaeodactylibacter sp.]
KAMVNAFRAEWPKVMGEDSEPPEMTEEMKLLFVAIARGVVDHLVEMKGAFQLEFTEQGHKHLYGVYHTPTSEVKLNLATGIDIKKE